MKASERDEIRQASDREIWIDKNRLCLVEDDILYITAVGEIDDKTALKFKDAVLEFNTRSGKIIRRSLIDINRSGKISSEARKLFKQITDDNEIINGRIAFFGMHPVARVIASFFMGMSKKKDMRFFKTKEDALMWLRGAE